MTEPRGPMRSPDEPAAGGPTRRRDASVNLRTAGPVEDRGSMLDPANQSLSDALRITLKLVRSGMLVLLALFVASGAHSIRESQRAVRLTFGAVQDAAVEPGLRWAWPYPVGEFVRVDVGQAELALDDSFWINITDRKLVGASLDTLPAEAKLTPGQGGSVLTGDGSIAHVRVRVQYQRTDPVKWARNVLPETEAQLVRASVMRGVVHASAGALIDSLLKQAADERGGVSSRARAVAQSALDAAESGITIQQLLLVEITPPLQVRKNFNNVLEAVTEAGKARNDALSEASATLNETAGEAHEDLIRLIDQYELAIEGDTTKDKDALLAAINGLMEGQTVEVEEGPQKTKRPILSKASGKVAKTIAEARRYRSEIVNRRRAELGVFNEKLSQFQANPRVMLTREWHSAYAEFIERSNVQSLFLPQGVNQLQLVINRDPSVLREQETQARQKEAEEAKRKRTEEFQKQQFRTPTGVAPRQ